MPPSVILLGDALKKRALITLQEIETIVKAHTEWAWEEMYWCGHSAVLQEASLRLSHRRLACKVPVEGN